MSPGPLQPKVFYESVIFLYKKNYEKNTLNILKRYYSDDRCMSILDGYSRRILLRVKFSGIQD